MELNHLTIKIHPNYLGIGKMYDKKSLDIYPGLTVLVGCNGYGKSTMINQIIESLRHQDIKYMHFNNLTDGGTNAMQALLMGGSVNEIARMAVSSEGEKICDNLGNLAHNIGAKLSKMSSGESLVILCDAIDSGFSIDNILDAKNAFEIICIKEKTLHNIDVYFIISANSYELAHGERCLDVKKCEYINFSTYEEYFVFIMKTRKIKNTREARWQKAFEKKQQKEKERKDNNV